MTEEKPQPLNQREKDLIKAVFSTPQGLELLEIWETKLINVAVWDQNLPEEVCRHIGGRHSVYRDIIKLARGPK